MRAWVMGVMVVVMAAGPAWARLGESPKQCAKRYGEPVSFSEQDGAQVGDYIRNGIHIRITFTLEKVLFGRKFWAERVVYSRPAASGSGNEELKAEELQTLLEANAQKSRWQELDPVVEAARFPDTDTQVKILRDGDRRVRWRREDGAVAIYDRATRELDVRAVAPTNRPEGDQRAAPGLEGF